MKAADWTAGHWPKIIDQLVGSEYADGKHHACPRGDGKDCFRFSNVNGKGNYFCRCSEGGKDGFELIQCACNTDFAGAVKMIEGVIGKRPAERPQVRQTTHAERLRRQATKTPRSAYLEGRGLIVAPGLDWHPSTDYFVDGRSIGRYPAMLAPVSRDGKFLTYHCTYLDHGRKADVEVPRKILPGPRANGGAVELWPAGDVLGIAEGIETAIAASMLYQVPTWAALNTSLMKSFVPPKSVKLLMIFGDNDANYAGQAAAYALAHRLHDRLKIEVNFPSRTGQDFNDVLLERKLVA